MRSVHPVTMFRFVSFHKFWLPIGLHSSCSFSPVEHVKNALQNITAEWTPRSVQSELHLEDIGGDVLEDRDQVDGDLLVVAAVLQNLKEGCGKRLQFEKSESELRAHRERSNWEFQNHRNH